MNTGAQIFLIPISSSFQYVCRCEIAESYDYSMFNFLRGCHTVFHKGCIILHPNQLCTSVSVSLHPHQPTPPSFFFFFDGSHPNEYVVLICILLMINDGSMVKNLTAKAGDAGNTGSIPWLGRSPGAGNGNPL